MICLSKNLSDEYINKFAHGAGLPIYDYDNYPSDGTILIRSMGLSVNLCTNVGPINRDFYYMDSGYVGNYKSKSNPNGWKVWHRIVKNDVQHNEIIDRPDDRWKRLDYPIGTRKHGNHILLVTPSEKPCKFYGIDKDTWVSDTIAEIKKHTDRPIIVRDKAPRPQRVIKTIFDDFDSIATLLVTYQSVAAIESVLFGVPAFTLSTYCCRSCVR